MPAPEHLAATNGAAGGGTPHPGARHPKRWIVAFGIVAFAGAWTVAIAYSVTAGGRSPERLAGSDARVVDGACTAARRSLAAIPQLGPRPARGDVAGRLTREDAVFQRMIRRLESIRPSSRTPAQALAGWLGDWRALVAARERFARALRDPAVARPQFVEPATNGVDPVADKMNNWVLEQGTRTNQCKTDALQVEVVGGRRTYTNGSSP